MRIVANFYFLAALRSRHRGSIVIAQKNRPPTFDGFTRFMTPRVRKSGFFMCGCMSVCLSVGLSVQAHISGSTRPIWTKFSFWDFFMNISRRFFLFLKYLFFLGLPPYKKKSLFEFSRKRRYKSFSFFARWIHVK